METKEKSIYDLKLHETCRISIMSCTKAVVDYYSVIRVPGGWIYHLWDLNTQTYTRDFFVPFNNEFQK